MVLKFGCTSKTLFKKSSETHSKQEVAISEDRAAVVLGRGGGHG